MDFTSERVQTIEDLQQVVRAVDVLRPLAKEWAYRPFGYLTSGGYGHLAGAITGLLTNAFDAVTASRIYEVMIWDGADCMTAILTACKNVCEDEITAQRATDMDLAISRGHDFRHDGNGYAMTYYGRAGMIVASVWEASENLAIVGRELRRIREANDVASRDLGRGLPPFVDYLA